MSPAGAGWIAGAPARGSRAIRTVRSGALRGQRIRTEPLLRPARRSPLLEERPRGDELSGDHVRGGVPARPHMTYLSATPSTGRLLGQGLLIGLLCIRVWITCVKRRRGCVHIGEMLGSPLPAHPYNEVVTWENTVHALCIDKGPKLSTNHAAMADK